MINNFKKTKAYDMAFRIVIVILANIVLQLATMWFLEPAKLYAGGATGLAQLILRSIYRINNISFGDDSYHYFLALTVFIVNIPFLIIGWKYVSFNFAFYSLIAVLIQVIVSLLAPASSSPFVEMDNGVVTNTLALALMGGLLSGLGSGFALKFGTSTGGIDIIAQAFALRKGMSIGIFTLIANVIIAIVGGGCLQGSWPITLYTCLRMIINSLVTDKIHTAYTYSALNIFTTHEEEISQKIMHELNRGVTVMNVIGEYTHQTHKELYCVVSTYEVEKVVKIVKEFDDKAFITISPVRRVIGNFVKKTIA
jgi:uncharacterized membrane-anchored protein YitT (DUF2179 family)